MKVNVLSGSRQSGKTTALVDLTLAYAREHNHSRVLFVGNYNAGLDHAFELAASKEHAVSKGTGNPKRLYLFNGSIITFLPVYNSGAIRGMTIDAAFIDNDYAETDKLSSLRNILSYHLPENAVIWETEQLDKD